MTIRSLKRALVVLVMAVALTAAGWPYLPPDLQRSPIYAWEFFTKENGTVNTPFVHEMFGLAMGVPDVAARATRFRVAAGWELSVFATDIPREGHLQDSIDQQNNHYRNDNR